jgi:phosphate transport system permease protein
LNTGRRVLDKIWVALALVAVVAAVAPLASILYFVIVRGISQINLTFLTQLPAPPGYPGGGIANALQGTLILIALASAVGIPVGVLSGVYVSEYGAPRYAGSVRFVADVLAGVPSIVTGVLVYLLIVIPTHSFSALAGGFALGTIMIPIVSSTTSEALKLVPSSIREASAALGILRWRTTLTVISNARAGIMTGVFLGIARTTGETAPLLLTTLGSTLWFSGVNQPTASLTLLIYDYATSASKQWQAQAWGASLILVLTVLGIDVLVRAVTKSKIRYAQ